MAACQPIRTPISANQTTSYWSPPPFFVSFLSPFFLAIPPFICLPSLFLFAFCWRTLVLNKGGTIFGQYQPTQSKIRINFNQEKTRLNWNMYLLAIWNVFWQKHKKLSNMSTTTKNYYMSYIGTINLLWTDMIYSLIGKTIVSLTRSKTVHHHWSAAAGGNFFEISNSTWVATTTVSVQLVSQESLRVAATVSMQMNAHLT